jgi:hypothetical protein
LCITGIEKQFVEKDVIKFLRKYLESSTQELPVHSVHKKRGPSYGFLSFVSREKMD